MTQSNFAYMTSPLGLVEVEADESAIKAIYFVEEKRHSVSKSPVLDKAVTQLQEYFKGVRKNFELPLSANGTEFQRQVWDALCSIPFGETRSYLDIANQIGKPKAVRAVGAANGKNPISVVVPCHRVIGKNGTLTGYAGGLSRKHWLLELEQK